MLIWVSGATGLGDNTFAFMVLIGGIRLQPRWHTVTIKLDLTGKVVSIVGVVMEYKYSCMMLCMGPMDERALGGL